MKGVNVTGARMHDPADDATCLLRIEVWPLPNDIALLNELMTFARAAIHARLTEHGLTSSEWHDAKSSNRMDQ